MFRKPWEILGLTKGAYYWRLKRNQLTCEQLQIIKYELGALKARTRNRFSGRSYDNPPEKLNTIREKYKNGITPEIWMEFVQDFDNDCQNHTANDNLSAKDCQCSDKGDGKRCMCY